MKKLLLIFVALLVSGAMMAQGSKGKMTPKSFLAFHGGPSFTIGDFNSTDENNEKAGFAKTGLNLNLNYGYLFNKNIGITAAGFYNRYNLDKGFLHDLPGTDLDHWQFYGLSVGPMFSHAINDKMAVDLRIMGGVANANTPRFTFDGELLIKEDWKMAFMFQGGLDLRINTGGNVFIFTNADYMGMQPEFKIEDITGTEVDRRHQTISVINVTGGVGIKF